MAKDILSIFCPSCGAPAEYDIVHQFYRCSYCGERVGLEDARREKAQYQSRIRQRVRQDIRKYPLMTTSCTGCGATLVFEENEAVSSCDFCGRKLVRKKYSQSKEEPEGIIPFAVTADEAKEKLTQWCEQNKHKREARHLLEKVNHVKGYYLPYQMARGPVSCKVNKKHDTAVFEASGYLQDSFVNCSRQLDNLVLDAMEPYDLTELKEFDYAYVAGQRVKITDITPEETEKRLREEVNSNYRVFMEKIWGTKAIDLSTTVETVVQFPVLLPVYYIREGNVSAAVNGQTGKVSVRAEKESIHISLPWWLEAILLFIAACALVFGIGWLLSGDFQETLAFTGLLGVFYLFIFCFMFEPGLDNLGSITRYRNIFTSGEQTFRREQGQLVPRDEVLKRRIAEPVFLKKLAGKLTPVTYVFRSKARILSMIALAMLAVFFPVILALFINGFNFAKLNLGGSAAWFCVTVPTAPVVLIQTGLKELYSSPWIYTISPDGKKKRWHEHEIKPGRLVKDALTLLFGLCLHPLGWLALLLMGTMIYVTAFGF